MDERLTDEKKPIPIGAQIKSLVTEANNLREEVGRLQNKVNAGNENTAPTAGDAEARAALLAGKGAE